MGYALLAAVRKRGVKRLFIDGINGLRYSAENPARISRYLAALTNALRAEGVTVMFSLETEELIGGETKVQFGSISAVAQNIMLLRYVEMTGETSRVLAVMKVRHSNFDPTLRPFVIASEGVAIGVAGSTRLRQYDDVLTGHAHLRQHPEGDDGI